MNLFEGNVTPNFYFDNTWGSNSHTTVFRNRVTGWQAGKTLNTHALSMEAHSRSNNVVGNIIGTDGYHTVYESPLNGTYTGAGALYKLGYWTSNGGSLNNYDAAVHTTLLRHANYDTVNDRVLYCDSDGGPGCQGGNASRTLPDSLYLGSKPAWFGNCVWPPFNPVGAAANDLPAKLRFNGASCGTTP
jgi:hypothetical protein